MREYFAEISTYFSDGNIHKIEWFYDSNLITKNYHRVDGPAFIRYFKFTPTIKAAESWYINGQRHRIDGPAHITYSTKGSILVEEWFIKDISLHTIKLVWLKENDIIPPYTDEDITAIVLRWG